MLLHHIETDLGYYNRILDGEIKSVITKKKSYYKQKDLIMFTDESNKEYDDKIYQITAIVSDYRLDPDYYIINFRKAEIV